jgi:hypothetical protein
MSDLHKYLQDYVKDLQQLLYEHSDKEAIIAAAEKQWPEEDDPRQELIFSIASLLSESADKGGTENGDGQVNVLVRSEKM